MNNAGPYLKKDLVSQSKERTQTSSV